MLELFFNTDTLVLTIKEGGKLTTLRRFEGIPNDDMWFEYDMANGKELDFNVYITNESYDDLMYKWNIVGYLVTDEGTDVYNSFDDFTYKFNSPKKLLTII